jgi:hypothetical protein
MNSEPSGTPDTLAPTCVRSQAILELSWTHFCTLSKWLDGMSKAIKRALGDSAESASCRAPKWAYFWAHPSFCRVAG